MTEKKKPTYDIDAIKEAFCTTDRLVATMTAIRSANAMGLGQEEIVETIQTIRRSYFYKSMTSYSDHRIWQDVYYVPSVYGMLYVKFTVNILSEFLLLSFKEKNNE